MVAKGIVVADTTVDNAYREVWLSVGELLRSLQCSQWHLCDRMYWPPFLSDRDKSRPQRSRLNERVRDAWKPVVHNRQTKPGSVHQCPRQHPCTPRVCIVERTLEHRNRLQLERVHDVTLLQRRFVFLPKEFDKARQRICRTSEKIWNDLQQKVGVSASRQCIATASS